MNMKNRGIRFVVIFLLVNSTITMPTIAIAGDCTTKAFVTVCGRFKNDTATPKDIYIEISRGDVNNPLNIQRLYPGETSTEKTYVDENGKVHDYVDADNVRVPFAAFVDKNLICWLGQNSAVNHTMYEPEKWHKFRDHFGIKNFKVHCQGSPLPSQAPGKEPKKLI